MNIICNGITVAPDLSSMPQNEYFYCDVHNWLAENRFIKECDICKSFGILAEMAELTSNSD